MADITISVLDPPNGPDLSYTLEVRYSHGVARIELPIIAEIQRGNDGIEACRKALVEFLDACQDAVLVPQRIHWPYPQGDKGRK